MFKFDVKYTNEKLKSRNIKCLSQYTDYKNCSTKLKWHCLVCDNIWFSTYTHLMKKNPSGCPKCGIKKTGDSKRLLISIDDINKILKERKIKCLSNSFIGVNEKHDWKCLKCKHIWTTDYNTVVNQKRGCRKCGYMITSEKKLSKISINDINKDLIERNIKCLSEKYLGIDEKHNWECLKCGNIWECGFYSVVTEKSKCPECRKEERSGENHHNWRGGISYKSYPKLFLSGELRNSIRNRDNHKCQFPNCDYDDTKNKMKLDVHHIDGNKKDCSNRNLISLCRKHHASLLYNYKDWQDYFYFITESYEL